MPTAREHLEWCKKRALQYVDAGQLADACASMLSDLSKHPETADHIAIRICPIYTIDAFTPQRIRVREWIEGFQ